MTDNALLDADRPLGEHLLLDAGRHKGLLHEARAALVQAHSLLGIVLGSRLVDLRAKADPLLAAEARIEEAEARAGALEDVAALLGARWDKVPDRKRPHYTPEQRFRIVRLRRVLHLSVGDTALLFRVSPDTIYEWDREARREPDKESIGSLVTPTPPVRRYDDLTHHLVQVMAMLGFGGHLKIAECLANAGIRLHKRTVARYRRQKPVPPPEAPPTGTADEPATKPTLVIARSVHHVWMTDLTIVSRLFGFRPFFVAAILDVYSRMPLAVETYTSQPSAEQVARLLDKTTRRFGWPRHLVSDQGSQFTSDAFTDRLKGLGIRQRFGAVGQKGSIAIMERFWRTMKASLGLRPLPPLTQEDLEQRLEVALNHYAYFRPHTGLGGATPATFFSGDPPPHVTAVHPGRGRPGAPSTPLPVEIVTLDKQGRFPVLRKAA